MTVEPPSFGDEYRRRESPKLRTERLRKRRNAALFGVVAGGVVLAAAVVAVFRRGWGAMMNAGPQGHFLDWPWEFYALAGAAVLAGSLWLLIRPPR